VEDATPNDRGDDTSIADQDDIASTASVEIADV
jgi:hypothetical protein